MSASDGDVEAALAASDRVFEHTFRTQTQHHGYLEPHSCTVAVEADGTVLATLGPGSVLGERASLEQGRRTATVRALTDGRIVSYRAADLPPDDLRELAAGHHREDQR